MGIGRWGTHSDLPSLALAKPKHSRHNWTNTNGPSHPLNNDKKKPRACARIFFGLPILAAGGVGVDNFWVVAKLRAEPHFHPLRT